MKMHYVIQEYVAPNGTRPFTDWLLGLKDSTARGKIAGRMDRAANGNFGDWKPLSGAKGVFEMREHYGSGYRIYFSIVGQKIVLFLAGSDKKDQNRMIAKAKEYLADYERRSKP